MNHVILENLQTCLLDSHIGQGIITSTRPARGKTRGNPCREPLLWCEAAGEPGILQPDAQLGQVVSAGVARP